LDKNSIKSLTRISRSLWGDLEKSVAISEDTLTSVSLLQLSDERTLERASKVMIERAEKNPPRLLALQHPFYRLAPIERFLLTALHVEKWSYARIARVLGIEENLIEPWAWATRIKYAFQELEAELEYPRGPATLGASCPEYNVSQPWAQRLLDDELAKRERMFLQNHLLACEKCRKSLDLTRRMFFKIEGVIPVKDAHQETEIASERLYRTWKAGESAFRPIKTTLKESLIVFFNQTSVQYTIILLMGFIFYLSKSH
jgi:hypothetical protein